MDVSMGESNSSGQELIKTVVSLTGLPEPVMRNELNEILENAGQTSHDLTLDQLREAMVAYLEALQASLIAEDHISEV
jgi:hypothetical protein